MDVAPHKQRQILAGAVRGTQVFQWTCKPGSSIVRGGPPALTAKAVSYGETAFARSVFDVEVAAERSEAA